MRRLMIFLSLIAGILTACVTPPKHAADDDGLTQRLKSHIVYLTSDELQGREAGTDFEKKAASYLAEQLQQMGVKPYAYCDEEAPSDSLCYFQPFSATRTTVYRQTSITVMDSSGESLRGFTWGDDFANYHDMMFPVQMSAPVVFAGYGITAPEFNYDDYQFLDVSGKFVMVLDGEPVSANDDYFYGDIPSSYSSPLFYKRHRAKELGARGIIVLAEGKLREQWSMFSDYFKSSSLDFSALPEDSADESGRMPFLYATPNFFRKVIDYSLYSLDSIEARSATGGTVPHFDIPAIRLSFRAYVRRTAVPSNNVIGYIEGTDPDLRKEYVAIGAHYDHLGKNEKGEIYYGADDNASGVSATLEIARYLVARPVRRSVLIIFHGAEEKGLLGSDYITMPETPKPFDITDVVTYLNLDMIGRGHTDSMFVIGSSKISLELKNLIESINTKGKYFHFDYVFDREDDKNYYYYRSDHYHYAKYSVPIAFFFDGMTEDYHYPSDTEDKIDYVKIRKMALLGHEIIQSVGNRERRFRVTEKMYE